MSNVDDAIADYNRAIELSPGVPKYYSLRARARAAKGDNEGAAADNARADELSGIKPATAPASGPGTKPAATTGTATRPTPSTTTRPVTTTTRPTTTTARPTTTTSTRPTVTTATRPTAPLGTRPAATATSRPATSRTAPPASRGAGTANASSPPPTITGGKTLDQFKWKTLQEGCDVTIENGVVHIVGKTNTSGNDHWNGLQTTDNFREQDVIFSVEFQVADRSGPGDFQAGLEISASAMHAGRLLFWGDDYRCQFFSYAQTLKALGDEDRAFHRLTMQYDAASRTLAGWVDQELCGVHQLGSLGSNLRFKLAACGTAPGMNIDVTFRNFQLLQGPQATAAFQNVGRMGTAGRAAGMGNPTARPPATRTAPPTGSSSGGLP